MSLKHPVSAGAKNLPDMPVVLVTAPELAGLLQEIRSMRAGLERFKKAHSEIAIRTTNEIDGLFAKVDSKVQAKPGRKQEARIGNLEALLIARGNEALTFAEVGKYLELGSRTRKGNTGKQDMTALGKILERDNDRFQVFESDTQKGHKMVRYSGKHLAYGPNG